MSDHTGISIDKETLKSKLIFSLQEIDHSEICKLLQLITSEIAKHVETMTSYEKDLNILLAPHVFVALEHECSTFSKNYYNHFADSILHYIFMEPRNGGRVYQAYEVSMNDKELYALKFRDNIDIKFYDLIFMLFDIHNTNKNHLKYSSVLSTNICQYIEKWLYENTPLIKSSNKK